jgi:hypothetical protein
MYQAFKEFNSAFLQRFSLWENREFETGFAENFRYNIPDPMSYQ